MGQSPEHTHELSPRRPEELLSHQKLQAYLTEVLVYSHQHPDISGTPQGYDTLVPDDFPKGWEAMRFQGAIVGHLTLKDASGGELVYCKRPEGFDGFIYNPDTSLNRYLPITHYQGRLLLGVTPKSGQDYAIIETPLPSSRLIRNYKDPFIDIFPERLPIIDHRQRLNPNSAWIITQDNRGLRFSGQAIRPQDIEQGNLGTQLKNPRHPLEKNIIFLPPENILINRCGPTVAGTIIALENRYQISDISHPLPFKPITYSETGTSTLLDTASFSPQTGGWHLTEINGEKIDPLPYLLSSQNKRMGVSIQTGCSVEGKDIFRINEIGGGGSVVVPYFIDNGKLYVGVIEEARPNVSDQSYDSVVRGFVNPGDTHQETISHEIREEMGYDGDPRDIGKHLQSLGIASQDPNIFGPGGVHYYALPIDKNILTEKDGVFLIDPSRRANTQKYDQSSEKLWEKIIGAKFIPVEDVLENSPCMFAVIATGRLLTSDLIPRPSH